MDATKLPPDHKHLLFCLLITMWFGIYSFAVVLTLAMFIYSPGKILPPVRVYVSELVKEISQLYKYATGMNEDSTVEEGKQQPTTNSTPLTLTIDWMKSVYNSIKN